MRHLPAAQGAITGAANDQGVPYVSTDRRMQEALQAWPEPEQNNAPESTPHPSDPLHPQPSGKTPPPSPVKATPGAPIASPSAIASPKAQALAERLREYEISRFMAGTNKPSRFGNKRISLKVFFTNEATVEFSTDLQGKDGRYQISATSGHYTLAGSLEDKAPQRSEGDFYLTDNKAGTTVRILYEAYKAKLTVRRDREKPLTSGSETEKRLKELEDKSFGWVHNWAVVRGKAFYIVDIVKVVGDKPEAQEDNHAPLLAFKGESLRTGEQEYPAQVLTPEFVNDVKLVGNSEEQGLRVISAEIADPKSQEKYEFMLDVEEQKDGAAPATPGNATGDGADSNDSADLSDPNLEAYLSSEQPAAETPAEEPSENETQPAEQDYTNYARPAANNGNSGAQAKAKSAPSPAAKRSAQSNAASSPINGVSYLRINSRLPRTARMAQHFARNHGLPGVQRQIKAFRSSQRLVNFYYYAFPLRRLIEAIGEAFDVAPSYAYLSIIESAYFTGGQYNNRQRGDYSQKRGEYLAYGPFQMHPESAKESGLRVTHDANDERFYFAPSACGAARYMMTLADQFRDSDMTLSILAYNQGGGGAQRLARRYGYTFVRMSASSLIPRAIREYVEKKLAVYFISSNMPAYGHNINRYVNRSAPPRNTVVPPRPIQDSHCRAVVQSAYSI